MFISKHCDVNSECHRKGVHPFFQNVTTCVISCEVGWSLIQQKSLNVVDTTQNRRDITAGEHRPTYLIRVSVWKKVPENGEYDSIDNGRDCIVEGYDMNKGDLTTMTLTEEEKYEVQFSPSTRSKTTINHVTYEELLQQICKDFDIEYLWYDKKCIDQFDDEIKLLEIKQMHKIYSNACYTVAIVPEVHIHDPKDFDTINSMFEYIEAWTDMAQDSLWWKRSWTLEETMSSKRILVIGTDTYLWQHSFHTCNIPTLYDSFSDCMLDIANQQQGGGSVNQALNQAHFRTSSKEHDKIFSLANIFPDMFKNMEINYKIDIKTTFHHFYQIIAVHDLSILCFSSNLFINGEEIGVSTMKNHNLPSWTGVSGRHLEDRVTTTITWLQHQHSTCDYMLLHISTKYYKTLSVTPFEFGCFSSLSYDKHQWYQQIDKFIRRWETKSQSSTYCTVEEDVALIDRVIKTRTVSGYFATHYYQPQDAPAMQARTLSLTEDCDECIILPILFKSYKLLVERIEELSSLHLSTGNSYGYFLPVIKIYVNAANGTKEQYKAIGVYYLGSTFPKDFISDDPDEILSSIFGDVVHNGVKEFIIQ
ncbi:hypothetical protein BDA99DRAFT_537640 [Phascolomyces articulosus]|uniref:Heterokaryon incompatibility domain-containing protein n=1 Tax=Phascolomyces articulosus TaxID=60185 RepID=A0AAD5JZX4_9FUNG|nr:hypothetical protein BDA99DRAFT_537640 [Phascolomyces articulosus]